MYQGTDRHSRDLAAEILHAHGAEFVGFYGRWAYESLPHDTAAAEHSDARSYSINTGADVVRIRLSEGGASILGAASQPVAATQIGAHLWLVSWRRNETAVVHAIDVGNGVAYTSVVPLDGEPVHTKGTVTPTLDAPMDTA